MRGLRSCGAGDGEPQPALTEMLLLPSSFILNILGVFAVSCLDVHLGTGRMQQRGASGKSCKEAGPHVGWGQQLLALQRKAVG